MDYFWEAVALPIKLVSCRGVRHKEESQDVEPIAEGTSENTLSSALHERDIYEMIRSFSDAPCLSAVSHTVREFEKASVSRLCFFHHPPEHRFLLQQVNIESSFVDIFNKLSNNSEHQRYCLLPETKDTFFLEDMLQRCNNPSDLAIIDIPPSKLKFKNRPFFLSKKGYTALRSIWVSYCTEGYRTVLAFSLPDDQRISFMFLYALFDLIKNMSFKNLTKLMKYSEFSCVKYFCLSTFELQRLINSCGSEFALTPLFAEYEGLQGLNCQAISVTRQEFFSIWPDLVELRISDLHLDPGICFDIRGLRNLQLLRLRVHGEFPIEIDSPRLRSLKIVLTDATNWQDVMISDNCTSLHTLILFADARSVFYTRFPKKLPALTRLHIDTARCANEDFLEIWRYSSLKNLSVCDNFIDELPFPTHNRSLLNFTIGGHQLQRVQYPKVASNLHTLGFRIIIRFNSTFIPSSQFPVLSRLIITECSMEGTFTVPSHFPLLNVVLLHKCHLNDVILPLPWRADIKIEFLDWSNLNDIYVYYSKELHYQIIATKEEQQYEITQGESQHDSIISKMGAVYRTEVVESIYGELYLLFQHAYFNQDELPILPLPLPLVYDLF